MGERGCVNFCANLKYDNKIYFKHQTLFVFLPQLRTSMNKQKLEYGCENCASISAKYHTKVLELEQRLKLATETCVEAQKKAEYWRKRATTAEQQYTNTFNTNLQLEEVTSDVCGPQELRISKMRKYYNELLDQYPALSTIMQPLFSAHFEQRTLTQSKLTLAGLCRLL